MAGSPRRTPSRSTMDSFSSCTRSWFGLTLPCSNVSGAGAKLRLRSTSVSSSEPIRSASPGSTAASCSMRRRSLARSICVVRSSQLSEAGRCSSTSARAARLTSRRASSSPERTSRSFMDSPVSHSMRTRWSSGSKCRGSGERHSCASVEAWKSAVRVDQARRARLDLAKTFPTTRRTGGLPLW